MPSRTLILLLSLSIVNSIVGLHHQHREFKIMNNDVFYGSNGALDAARKAVNEGKLTSDADIQVRIIMLPNLDILPYHPINTVIKTTKLMHFELHKRATKGISSYCEAMEPTLVYVMDVEMDVWKGSVSVEFDCVRFHKAMKSSRADEQAQKEKIYEWMCDLAFQMLVAYLVVQLMEILRRIERNLSIVVGKNRRATTISATIVRHKKQQQPQEGGESEYVVVEKPSSK